MSKNQKEVKKDIEEAVSNTVSENNSDVNTSDENIASAEKIVDELNKLKEDAKKSNVKVVKTDEGSKTGQSKCPKCGATDISLNTTSGKLRCNFCRHEFAPEKVEGLEKDLSKLEGTVIGSGASNIDASSDDIVTLKCSSCGAEVVVDTASSTQARCHWCRNMLSINEQIPNGAVPDVVLPFSVKKDEARNNIETFVKKRRFFAHPTFVKEFTTENIMGVYFPYMVIDVNGHSNLSGEGEHLVRSYTVGSDEHKETYYDADAYHVEREFDIVIDGLTVESNKDRLNKNDKEKTNNIINSIMPFDIENCVKYDSNYLNGYTSEKRDTNIEDLKDLAYAQSKDIAKFSVNDTLKNYDRGVRWETEDFKIKGEQWKAAYLPVWLYSYMQVKGDKKLLHYVAVNARTKETMGSVPIHMPKLVIVSILVEILGFILMLNIDFDYNWLFLSLGFIYFFAMYSRYRNSGARHNYETETKTNVANLRKQDAFMEHRKRLSNSMIHGANNKTVTGENVKNKMLNSLIESNGVASFAKKAIEKTNEKK